MVLHILTQKSQTSTDTNTFVKQKSTDIFKKPTITPTNTQPKVMLWKGKS